MKVSLAVAASGSIVVLLAVLAGVLGLQARSAGRVDRARTDGLAAARAAAQHILSYDYRHLDADFAQARKETTGTFTAEYAKTTTTVVKPTALKYHVVVAADVRAASVVTAESDQVVVLLFVNQSTTSTRVAGPKIDQSRVRMTLVHRRGRWLVSKVDAL